MKTKEDAPNFKESLNGIMTIRGQGKFFYFNNPKPRERKERGEYIQLAKDWVIRGFLVF